MTSESVHIAKLRLEGAPPRRWRVVAAIIGLAVLVGVTVEIIARHDRAELARRDALWRVEGPPCASLDPMVFKSLRRLPQATPYDDALFRRLGGTMSCTHLVDKTGGVAVRYPVCKFSAPDYLVVSLGGRDQFYDLTGGRGAAVVVRDGEARCMVLRPFKM